MMVLKVLDNYPKVMNIVYFFYDKNNDVEGFARQPINSDKRGDQHDDGHRRQEQRRVRHVFQLDLHQHNHHNR